MNAWPTYKVEIEGYEGWYADMYDFSVGEVDKFEEAMQSEVLSDIAYALLPSVKYWTFTDREGNRVDVSAEGMKEIPMRVIRILMMRIMDRMNEDVLPKVSTTDSSDITQP